MVLKILHDSFVVTSLHLAGVVVPFFAVQAIIFVDVAVVATDAAFVVVIAAAATGVVAVVEFFVAQATAVVADCSFFPFATFPSSLFVVAEIAAPDAIFAAPSLSYFATLLLVFVVHLQVAFFLFPIQPFLVQGCHLVMAWCPMFLVTRVARTVNHLGLKLVVALIREVPQLECCELEVVLDLERPGQKCHDLEQSEMN